MSRARSLIAMATLMVVMQRPLAAQLQIGGSIGVHLDESTDFVVVGGQLRIPIGQSGWIISPRIESFSGLSITEGDLDLLYQISTSRNGALRPYVGIGGGMAHLSDEDFSETKPVANLLFGTRLAPKGSAIAFFLESHYTLTKNLPDREVVSVGLLLSLGKH